MIWMYPMRDDDAEGFGWAMIGADLLFLGLAIWAGFAGKGDCLTYGRKPVGEHLVQIVCLDRAPHQFNWGFVLSWLGVNAFVIVAALIAAGLHSIFGRK